MPLPRDNVRNEGYVPSSSLAPSTLTLAPSTSEAVRACDLTIGHSHILYSAQVGVTDPAQRSKRNRITELKSKPQESSRPFTREDFELGAHFKFGVWESDLVLVMCV